jgi:putative glutamine amidotransferase
MDQPVRIEAATHPVIALPGDVQRVGDQDRHTIDFVPVNALRKVLNAAPVIIPAVGEVIVEDVIDRVDGVLVGGGLSNIHPSIYGRAPTPEDEPFDRARDATAIPLIRAALDRGVPILMLCRGFQELNVALGGTLRTEPKDLPMEMKHGNPKPGGTEDEQYAIRQNLNVVPGGQLDGILRKRFVRVNSVHSQVVDKLASGLVVEATADDGTVESVTVRNAKGFALGCVFHPDYWAASDGPSTAIFRAFAEAVQRYATALSGREHA